MSAILRDTRKLTTANLPQLLLILVDHIESSWQDLLLPNLSDAAACGLGMTAQRLAVSETAVLDLIATAHPLINLFSAYFNLAFNTLRELPLQCRQLIGERSGREAELIMKSRQ